MNPSKFQIKQISAQETYKVRLPVLRPGKPVTSCIFEGDDLESTIHIGIYLEDSTIGICSFFKNKHPLILDKQQYQLRGMAVLEAYQGMGIGNKVLHYGEALLQSQNITTIWCNARKVATPFYEKCGYQIFGKPFNIPDIGTHYTMQKLL
ncbi:GNAT family N-acetyltransferase [Pseudotamlana carrageenivorans]|uniref:GNAT family N-acetyltransferase n=1 Tax=Pseudotamlana carrageenivorans TaxID=2069432 RepID=A0A2I7SN14_9FLAO|nr:GNAT family N-acetyltransferase [Tamlana carrageenivorans]AUS07244.1 GNAT family N-acetyltransferase [Tamlana carrageenivorans]